MLDYGRVQTYLYREGKALEVPPPAPPRVPDAWDPTSTGMAWDAAMARLEFDASVCDEARWIYSNAPQDNCLGITLIIYFTDGRWLLDFGIDTLATEDNNDWDMGIEAPAHCTTPLAVAKWAKEHVEELLVTALKTLTSGRLT